VIELLEVSLEGGKHNKTSVGISTSERVSASVANTLGALGGKIGLPE
jgi:hypothetical protein